jgi:pyruvyltransferase
VRANWCRSCGAGANFGDQLTPVLLRHYGIQVTWARPNRAEIVVAGSILSKIPRSWSGTVLGTGYIRRGRYRNLAHARVLAVRGALTRVAAGLPKVPLGDPGILVPDILEDPIGSGVLAIPHYVDHDLVARHPAATHLDIRTAPREFVRRVAGASLVYTSSLHALIAADALGVPHVWEPHPAVIGDGFKFQDYASAFPEVIAPGVKRLTDRRKMTARQGDLRDLFNSLDKMR